MNRIAGLIGPQGSRIERETRLRNSFGDVTAEMTIIHPSSQVSLAWSSEPRFVSVAEEDGRFALLFGSVHPVNSIVCRRESAHNLHDWSKILLSRLLGGDRSLDDLGGSFIVIAGKGNEDVMIAGDPAGNRRPFHITVNENLGFSSHPLVGARLLNNPQIDRSLEDFLLIYGFLPDGRTPYEGVRELQPGQSLLYSAGSWKKQSIKKDPSRRHMASGMGSEELLLDRLFEVLLQCTEDQLPPESDVGVLLGGFDSALVAALLRHLGKQVHTYSFRYTASEYNQSNTEILSEYLKCKHTWVDITPEVIAEGLVNYSEQYIQPTNWPNYLIQTTHVCNSMRSDGITSAFSGDGCDAAFLGYPGTYLRTQVFSRLPSLPQPVVSALLAVFGSAVLDRKIGHPYRVAMGILRALAYEMPIRAFLTLRVMDEITLRALRAGDEPPQEESIDSIKRRLAAPFADLPIQRLGYTSKSLISPNRAKLLAATDVAGVSIDTPYNHPELRSFAAAIPENLLRRREQSSLRDKGKLCLMRMAERYRLLPDKVIHQPKLAAIDSPIDDWLCGELHSSLELVLNGLPFIPDKDHLNSLKRVTWAENLYKNHIGSTRVISDAISLLATYGAMCGALNNPKRSYPS